MTQNTVIISKDRKRERDELVPKVEGQILPSDRACRDILIDSQKNVMCESPISVWEMSTIHAVPQAKARSNVGKKKSFIIMRARKRNTL